MVTMVLFGGASSSPAALPAEVVVGMAPPARIIEQYVGEAVRKITGNDPVAQKAGREDLINYAPSGAAPSRPFALAYSQALNNQLRPLAKHPDFRVRLNAAIAAAKVAERLDSDAMVPLVQDFLKDSNTGVALWGMKAAKPIAPRSPNGPSLIPAVLASARQNPELTDAAYRSLAVSTPGSQFIDAIHNLINARLAGYANGTPVDPMAEFEGLRHLVSRPWWRAQSPAQQAQTAQLIASLSNAIAGKMKDDISPEQKNLLGGLYLRVAGSGEAMALAMDNDPLRNKMAALSRISLVDPPSKFRANANQVFPTLKEFFPNLKQP